VDGRPNGMMRLVSLAAAIPSEGRISSRRRSAQWAVLARKGSGCTLVVPQPSAVEADAAC